MIVRASEGVATLVHDEPGLKATTLVAKGDGLYARSGRGTLPIGKLTGELREDLGRCGHCFVVYMQGHRVIETSRAAISWED